MRALGYDLDFMVPDKKGRFAPELIATLIYTGQSIGASFGVPELARSGSLFGGVSKLINEK